MEKNEAPKIFKVLVTPEAVVEILKNKTIDKTINVNPLPPDSKFFNLQVNEKTGNIELFFTSDIEGVEVHEALLDKITKLKARRLEFKTIHCDCGGVQNDK